ncbi:hypothetical protein IJG04_02140 [Candidatus Saccharibacteria bacterium]|nr:hypothetical protein [Candidatus Saccharibacteria bacterium]
MIGKNAQPVSDIGAGGGDATANTGGDEGGAQINLAPKRRSKRKWVIISAGTGAWVVVVVTVAVAIKMSNGGGSTDIASEGESCNAGELSEEEIIAEGEAEVKRETIDDIAVKAESLPFDEAIEYVDDRLKEYNNTDYEFGIRLVKLYLLLNNGEADMALEESERIDPDYLSANELLDYYNVMAKIHENLGDEAIMMQYQDLYVSLYNHLYDDEEGGENLVDEEENVEEE